MNPECYKLMAESEAEHWWFRAKADIVINQLENVVGSIRGKTILDIGCGTGYMMKRLKELGAHVYGVDMSEAAARFAQEKVCSDVRVGEAENIPFPDHSFDIVLALDVIEHVDDDSKAVREAFRVLKQGGIMIATVPAFMFLWSKQDERLHHKRRYRKSEFLRLFNSDFEIRKLTYYNTLLFPPIAGVRFAQKLFPIFGEKDEVEVTGAFTNSVLYKIFGFEKHLVNRLQLPFGVSLIGVMRKSKSV